MEALKMIGLIVMGFIAGVFITVVFVAYVDGFFDEDLSKPHDDFD